jgi:hypothetical protein
MEETYKLRLIKKGNKKHTKHDQTKNKEIFLIIIFYYIQKYV